MPIKFYGKPKAIEEMEALDQKEENGRRYHKSSFRYDEVRDTYICLGGNELEQWGSISVKANRHSSSIEVSLAGNVQ